MSIKAIARELYRAQQQVEQLEKQLAAAEFPQQEAIKGKLRTARAEYEQLRRMLNGRKAC